MAVVVGRGQGEEDVAGAAGSPIASAGAGNDVVGREEAGLGKRLAERDGTAREWGLMHLRWPPCRGAMHDYAARASDALLACWHGFRCGSGLTATNCSQPAVWPR